MPSTTEATAVIEHTAPAADGKRYNYERRRPELGTLHQVVRENLHTLYAAVEEGSAAPLPEFVRREFEQFLDCGLFYALRETI